MKRRLAYSPCLTRQFLERSCLSFGICYLKQIRFNPYYVHDFQQVLKHQIQTAGKTQTQPNYRSLFPEWPNRTLIKSPNNGQKWTIEIHPPKTPLECLVIGYFQKPDTLISHSFSIVWTKKRLDIIDVAIGLSDPTSRLDSYGPFITSSEPTDTPHIFNHLQLLCRKLGHLSLLQIVQSNQTPVYSFPEQK